MAASNLQDIKRRIKSVTSTEHITNAMKLVSAAKLRRAKATFERTNEYLGFITKSIAEIFACSDEVPEKYVAENREIKKTCYIVVTSSKGLCGSYNSNAIKETEDLIRSRDTESSILAVGSKGRDYFAKRGYEICGEYMTPPEEITYTDCRQLAAPILHDFEEGVIDEVILVSTRFKNSMTQQIEYTQLLPFNAVKKEEQPEDAVVSSRDVDYEPSAEEVFNYLIPKYIEVSLYGSVIEAATCEHAARRMAMENATDNANEMLGQLSLFYNRARQAAITSEITEIVAGSEAQN